MILFGSRAAGDHRDDSDVDIMVVADHENHRTSGARAEQAALEYMRKNPPEMEIGVISMTRREFDRCRRTNQHIAGQAVNHGVNMSGERLDYRYHYDDEHEGHWVATRERIQTSEAKLMEFQADVENDHWNQARTGYEAEQSLEHAMKGLLSAHNAWGGYGHDIPQAWRKINELEPWKTPEEENVRESVQALLDHTTFVAPVPGCPEPTLNWLVRYATHHDYSNSSYLMSREDQYDLMDMTTRAVENLIRLTLIRSRTTEGVIWPDGIRPLERPQRLLTTGTP